MDTVAGMPLNVLSRLTVLAGPHGNVPDEGDWRLRGITSNERYVKTAEQKTLALSSPELGRPSDTQAALIPIRKSPSWWELSQEQRRDIFEARSHHIQIGLEYLPRIARRLYHCRDLDEDQPFDFLTWFEYAPEHTQAFEELVSRLRKSEEWQYVDREVDIRLMQTSD